MKTNILQIKEIIIEEKLYPRKKLSENIAQEYAELMRNGTIFPNPRIAEFKGKKYLIDGGHRIEAKKINGEKFIQCDIQTNLTSLEDIYVASVKANMTHGRKLSKQDKWKIASTMKSMKFKDEDISKLTNINTQVLNRVFSKKLNHILVLGQVKRGIIPAKSKETIKEKKTGELKIVDEISEEVIDQESGDFQIYQLTEMLDYFKTTKFDEGNSKVMDILKKIKKTLHKRYPKL